MPDALAQNHNDSTRKSLVAGVRGASNSGGDEAAEGCQEGERVVTAVTKARAGKSRTGSDDNIEKSLSSPSGAARQSTQVEATPSRTPSVTGLEGTRASQVRPAICLLPLELSLAEFNGQCPAMWLTYDGPKRAPYAVTGCDTRDFDRILRSTDQRWHLAAPCVQERSHVNTEKCVRKRRK
jgi:hypothetical protein